MSKANEIENHILRGESITGLLALDLYGVYRLSSVINRLRNKGLEIETMMIQKDDGTQYAKYILPIHARNANRTTS
jgi:hypothetical protein